MVPTLALFAPPGGSVAIHTARVEYDSGRAARRHAYYPRVASGYGTMILSSGRRSVIARPRLTSRAISPPPGIIPGPGTFATAVVPHRTPASWDDRCFPKLTCNPHRAPMPASSIGRGTHTNRDGRAIPAFVRAEFTPSLVRPFCNRHWLPGQPLLNLRIAIYPRTISATIYQHVLRPLVLYTQELQRLAGGRRRVRTLAGRWPSSSTLVPYAIHAVTQPHIAINGTLHGSGPT